ncbi:MAG TPA: hypothetical protein VMW24_17050 [Sedimentisphaerales bacterium]|nr:hypothetical protein [Sedimentisphaerales bacterium]
MLPNYTPHGWNEECDLYVVTRAMFTVEYEIKLSRADYRADRRKARKHERLAARDPDDKGLPTRFFYVMPEDMVSAEEVPDYAGLFYVREIIDQYSSRVKLIQVRPAPRLSNHKRADATLHAMGETAYYRFWNERQRFEEYRRQVAQAKVFAAVP